MLYEVITRTIVYKGMLLASQVGEYYLDLKDPRVESALALVHQRFSTNTFPSWDLAHPFRMIAHNGEINTLRGNINWMHARRHSLRSKLFGDDLHKLWPLVITSYSIHYTKLYDVTSAKGGTRPQVDNVDFRRGEHGEGRVIVSLSDPSIPVDIQQEGGNVIVDFYRATLPANLARRLDVLDFATPVKTIDRNNFV